MVTRPHLLILPLLLVLHGCGNPTQQQVPLTPPIKAVLEKALEDWFTAAEAGDESAFKRASSSYMYGTILNNLSLAKRKFDSFFVGFVKLHEDHMHYEFVTLVEQGKTAALVYRESAKDNPQHFYATRFVYEDDKWRVDKNGSLEGSRDSFDPSMLKADMAVDGVVRPAPAPAPVFDYAGSYTVQYTGCNAKVSVNGVALPEMERDGVIGGACGLNHGKNTVLINWSPRQGAQSKDLLVMIGYYTGPNGSETKEALKWKPKTESGTEEVIFEIP